MPSKYLPIQVLIIILLINLTFSLEYCDPEIKTILAFNLGRFVFIFDEEKVNNIWQFDSLNNMLLDQKLDISGIFVGNTLVSVSAAVGFNFNKCRVGHTRASYCEQTIKARNLVLAIGLKFQVLTDPPNIVYFAYRMESDNTPELSLLKSDSEMVWGLKTQGEMSDSFWLKDGSALSYKALVFVPQRAELYASVLSSDGKKTLMFKKLDQNGEWNQWTFVKDIGFIGLFWSKGRVFGMDSDNMITEFIWTDNKLGFEKNANSKEFFNCYQNSTLNQYKPTVKNEQIDYTLKPGQTSNEITDNSKVAAKSDAKTDKPDSKSNSKLILIIVIFIVLVIIVIIVAIVFWICLRKRNSKTTEASIAAESAKSSMFSDDSKLTGMSTKSSKMSKKPSAGMSTQSSKMSKKSSAMSSMSSRSKGSDKKSKISNDSKETIRSKY